MASPSIYPNQEKGAKESVPTKGNHRETRDRAPDIRDCANTGEGGYEPKLEKRRGEERKLNNKADQRSIISQS